MTHESKKPKRKLSLWLPVILAFCVLITAWTILILVAVKNPAETIPLVDTEKIQDEN